MFFVLFWSNLNLSMEWKWISAISLMHQLEQTYSVHFLLLFPSCKKRMNIEHTAYSIHQIFFYNNFFSTVSSSSLSLSLGWNDFSNKKDYFAVVVFDVIELECEIEWKLLFDIWYYYTFSILNDSVNRIKVRVILILSWINIEICFARVALVCKIVFDLRL